MPTYDPSSVTITIGGVEMKGFTSVEYRDGPGMDAVRANALGTVGSTRGRFVVEGSMELVGPVADARAAFATRAEVEAAGVRAVVPDASSELIRAAIEVARSEAMARLNPIMSLGDVPSRIVADLAAASLMERAGFAADSSQAQMVREMRRRADASLCAMQDWPRMSEMHGATTDFDSAVRLAEVDLAALARRQRIAKLRASLAALIAEPYPDLP